MTDLIRSLVAGRRPRPRALIGPLLLLAALLASVLSVRAAARAEVADGARTVVLVARDMTFYVEGRPDPNPRLFVARGETVRFELRNDDPGMGHDLSLPSFGKRSRLLRDPGTATELVVTMPETSGEHPYLCSLHALTMRGVVEVR